ncbi:MAG TPA: GNAT family N-acetyltransferase [Flavisolibacter sp.]|nr:GNAT family N-acetyltransferase [Flavisolibacter sp.]
MNDIPALVALINSAYRGEEAKQGWTHEADLIEGSIRTDNVALTEIMESKNGVILICKDEHAAIVGCVYLENQFPKLYLGMLSVKPSIQGGGIGKKLLQAADAHAIELGCVSIIMNVIPARTELIAWYKRNGYVNTGEHKPFPTGTAFGTPRMPLDFVVLEKQLA